LHRLHVWTDALTPGGYQYMPRAGKGHIVASQTFIFRICVKNICHLRRFTAPLLRSRSATREKSVRAFVAEISKNPLQNPILAPFF
jgi:hypothetical protein